MTVMVQRESVYSPPVSLSRLSEIESALGEAIRGKAEVLRLALACLLARGHLLIEDVPGVGKTTLAQAMARSVHSNFHRLQFTSDMLPSDVLGVTIYNAHTQEFEFKPGPIFTNFLLADEINRATPKTQSALLEAMNELQVTIDGRSWPLSQPFMVIATQNPVEHHGTYPLPESQLDRFLMRIRIGYPDQAAEREIVRQSLTAKPDHVRAAITGEELTALQDAGGSSSHGRRAGRLHSGDCRADPHARISGDGRQPARIAGAVPRHRRRSPPWKAATTPLRTTSSAWWFRCSRIAWWSTRAPRSRKGRPRWLRKSWARSSRWWMSPCKSEK